MSQKTIASALLRFANTTSLMMPGALIAEIGHDALREALSLGWLRPSEDTGLLMLTDQQSQLNTLREIAAAPEQETAVAAQPESASRAFAMNHSRRLHETLGLGADTSASGGAPGSGQPQHGTTMQTPTSPPPPPNPAPSKPGQNYIVGEDVVVADEGKTYQAKVQKTNPDGTYVLSFGANKPVNQTRFFKREEMQRLTPAGGANANTVQVQP